MHLVHVDASGAERAVLAVRIDPGVGKSRSEFLAGVPRASSLQAGGSTAGGNATAEAFPSFNATGRTIPTESMDVAQALQEVRDFDEFWTYQGSLTSPPCKEGIRFFVARDVMFVSNAQMQDVLRVSRFSARQDQEVWMHQINF